MYKPALQEVVVYRNNTQRVARQLKSNSPLHAACGNTLVCLRESGERSQEGEEGSRPRLPGLHS